MSTIRYSKQREAIKDYLKSVTCHPTADTVYLNIQKTFPNISLGTVYRNLNFLVEHGEAIQIDCGDDLFTLMAIPFRTIIFSVEPASAC